MAAWEAAGRYRQLAGHRVFVADLPATSAERDHPLLVVHGFPTSSFDFHLVVDRLRVERRVVLVDLVGFGLSDKPDLAYRVDLLADVVAAAAADRGLATVSLLTHDLGDTVGGELLARQQDGRWPVRVHRRVVTNGSIYIDMARLTDGQQLLLSLPDQRLPDGAPVSEDGLAAAVAATFAAGSRVDPAETAAAAELAAHHGGLSLLPRLVRYIEERRRNERRFTGAVESHPSPLTVVWGDEDPVAVAAMASRLQAARPDATVTWLDGVGHYPMLEDPVRFADAVLDGLG
ncbi:MAG TPA: alpha/beta hydrolase [Acidimicrobiales bacterium]|nr:alpha/beta hydrolase [Acidimicrobiales bacterium]